MARVFQDPAHTPRQCRECGEILESAGLYTQHYREAHVAPDYRSASLGTHSTRDYEYSRPLVGQAIKQKPQQEAAIMPNNTEKRKYSVILYLTPDQETAPDALASLNSVSRSKLVQPILQAKMDEVVRDNAAVVKQYLALRAKFQA